MICNVCTYINQGFILYVGTSHLANVRPGTNSVQFTLHRYHIHSMPTVTGPNEPMYIRSCLPSPRGRTPSSDRTPPSWQASFCEFLAPPWKRDGRQCDQWHPFGPQIPIYRNERGGERKKSAALMLYLHMYLLQSHVHRTHLLPREKIFFNS